MTINTINCKDPKKCNNVATIICPPSGPTYPCADLSIYDQSLSDNCEDSDDQCQSSDSNPVSCSTENLTSSHNDCSEHKEHKEHKNHKENKEHKEHKDKKGQSASNFSNSSVSHDNEKSSPKSSPVSNTDKVKTFSLSTCSPKHKSSNKLNLELENCCNHKNKVILKLKKGKTYNFDCKLSTSGYKVGFSYNPDKLDQIEGTQLMHGDDTFELNTKCIKSYCFLISEENPENRILVVITPNKKLSS